MEQTSFEELQIQEQRVQYVKFDHKQSSIYNSHLTFFLSQECYIHNIGSDFNKYLPLILQIIVNLEKISSIDSLYSKIRQVINSSKIITNSDVFTLHRNFFRIFIKHSIGLLSYLLKNMNIQTVVHQLQNCTIYFKVLSRQSAKFQTGFLSSQNNKKRQDFSTQEGESRIGDYGFPFLGQKSDNKVKKTILIKIKQFIKDNMKVMQCSNWILPNEQFIFYLIYKELKIGEGGFGTVYKAESVIWDKGKITEEVWAVKQLKRQIQETQNHRIGHDRQHQMLKKIKSINKIHNSKFSKYIIQIKEVLLDKNRKYIIFQYCQFGNLGTFTNLNRSQYSPHITKKHIFLIAYQLAGTLKYIHYQMLKSSSDRYILSSVSKDGQLIKDAKMMKKYLDKDHNLQHGVIHRDLKPSNIMVKLFKAHAVQIRIIDWAFSKATLTEQSINNLNCGTDNYQAPQFDQKQVKYNSKVDVWAFGMIIFYLLTGKHMIPRIQSYKLQARKKKIKQKINSMQFLSERKLNMEEQNFWKQLMINCLEFDPQQRWSSKKVIEYFQSHLPLNQIDQDTIFHLDRLYDLKKQYMGLQQIVWVYNSSKIVNIALKKIQKTVIKKYFTLINQALASKFVEKKQDQQFLNIILLESSQDLLSSKISFNMSEQLSQNHNISFKQEYALIAKIPKVSNYLKNKMIMILQQLQVFRWLN